MKAQCQVCGQTHYVSGLKRGERLADRRCVCGGQLKGVASGPPQNKGQKIGACPVCGKRRFGGRPCWWHTEAEKAAAKGVSEK